MVISLLPSTLRNTVNQLRACVMSKLYDTLRHKVLVLVDDTIKIRLLTKKMERYSKHTG